MISVSNQQSKLYQTGELTERDFLKSDVMTIDDGSQQNIAVTGHNQSMFQNDAHNFSFQEEQENERPEVA